MKNVLENNSEGSGYDIENTSNNGGRFKFANRSFGSEDGSDKGGKSNIKTLLIDKKNIKLVKNKEDTKYIFPFQRRTRSHSPPKDDNLVAGQGLQSMQKSGEKQEA